jgi:hypothetical protein
MAVNQRGDRSNYLAAGGTRRQRGSPVAAISVASPRIHRVTFGCRTGATPVDKFARGGTKAIDELRAPQRASLGACAVDPDSADLAVVGSSSEVSAQ